MTLAETIQRDVVTALKQKDTAAVSALRSLKAAVQRATIEHKGTLTDAQVIGIVQKEIKQRQDSITSYQAAQRTDLAATEQAELLILQRYQPKQLSTEEVIAQLQAIINAAPVKQFGPVMKTAMQQLAGQTDGATVQALLKQLLQ